MFSWVHTTSFLNKKKKNKANSLSNWKNHKNGLQQWKNDNLDSIKLPLIASIAWTTFSLFMVKIEFYLPPLKENFK